MIFVTAITWLIAILAGFTDLRDGDEKSTTVTDSDRFAVVRFSGESEFPHSNQILTEDINNRSAQEQSKVSKSGFEYLLVADQQQDELYLYCRRPLWRFDTGGIDEDWKTLWHQRGDAIDTYDAESGRQAGSSDMWSVVNVKSVFVDVLGLPVKSPVNKLNAKIRKFCVNGLDFGISESLTEGPSVTQRVVNVDTGELVVNNTVSGKLFVAASTLMNDTDHKKARCKVIIYLDDKPMETMAGAIECSFASTLPTAISEMLAMEVKPREDDLSIEESDRKQEEQPLQRPDGRWSIVVLVAGTICLAAVFVLRLVQVKKENE